MKARLFCKRTDLRTAVEHLMPAISARSPMVVLHHLEVELDPSQKLIRLSSTDLEVRISTSIPAQITLETDTPEAFLIPAQIFSDLLAIMEAEQIKLEIDGHHLLVQTGATKTRISLFAQDAFPPEFEMDPSQPSFSLSMATFRAALQRVVIAASSDTTRLNLNSIQIRILPEGRLHLTATDGFRLATESIPIKSRTEASTEFLLPLNVAIKLLRVLPNDEDAPLILRADISRCLFSWGQMRYWGLLPQSKFPDWERLIYEEDGKTLQGCPQGFDREALQLAVKRAEIFAREADISHLVYFKPTETGMLVSGQAAQIGQSEEEIACPITIPFALNGLFALKGLSALKNPRPTLSLSDSRKPVILSEDDFIYVVMPLAIPEKNILLEKAPVPVEGEPVPA